MTRLASIALSFVLGSFALVGCASSGDDGSATGDDQNITAGELGALCGGIAGMRCSPFLHCELNGAHADAAGTCQPGSDLGATCGGFAGLRCRDGFVCEVTAQHPDASGTCQDPAAGMGLGAMCGGFAGLRCRDGLECEVTAQHPDASGTCRVPAEPVQCMAMPSCDPDDTTLAASCTDKGCYQRTMCGKTAFCQAKK